MDWRQIHLALNHLPVIGLPLVLLLLMIGWKRRSEEVMRLALWAVVLLSVAAIAIKFTGDFAAEQHATQFVSAKEFVNRHEQAGDQVTAAVFLLAISTVLALWFGRAKRPLKIWTVVLVLALGLVASALYVRCAHSGGQISHPELRR
jgi:multisubunit Na+/H+ antiporter MnhB subunit